MNERAASLTWAAVTFVPHTFQEFQPIGGVRASVPVLSITSTRSADPVFEIALRTTRARASFATCPEMIPVAGSRVKPWGKPIAAKRRALEAVAGILNKNGLPAEHPTAIGPWISGLP